MVTWWRPPVLTGIQTRERLIRKLIDELRRERAQRAGEVPAIGTQTAYCARLRSFSGGSKVAIQTGPIEPHWNYFLALDSDLARLARYVEFSETNFACYSIEIARILLAAASEVDVVAKQLCEQVSPGCGADKIGPYRETLNAHLPAIASFEVVVARYGLNLRPWDEWSKTTGDRVPFWWTANNKVKHERHTHFNQATLKNALNAVAGLFVMLLYLYREQAQRAELDPSPSILNAHSRHVVGITLGTGTYRYAVPKRMGVVTLLAGLPGSGKTRLLKELEGKGQTSFDDFKANAPSDQFVSGLRYSELLGALCVGGCRCVVADVDFCRPEARADVENDLQRHRGIGVMLEWIYFANDPAACEANIRRRNRQSLDADLVTLRRYAAVYAPPPGIPVRPVVRE